MSWKDSIQVRDMDDKMSLECRCTKCGHTHYITKASICALEGQERLYLDEVEAKEKCKKRGCNGKIDIFLIGAHKVSPFIGGLA